MGVTVRVAGDDDVEVLVALRREWDEELAGGPLEDDGFEPAFRAWWEAERSTRTFFLIEADGLAVGMANVKHYDRMPHAGRDAGQWGYVGNVFVLEDRRNDHLGSVLMGWILAWAADVGLAHLRLAPSPRSREFYARLGYVPGAVVELDP